MTLVIPPLNDFHPGTNRSTAIENVTHEYTDMGTDIDIQTNCTIALI